MATGYRGQAGGDQNMLVFSNKNPKPETRYLTPDAENEK
jgi:hypothetical protein